MQRKKQSSSQVELALVICKWRHLAHLPRFLGWAYITTNQGCSYEHVE